MQANKPGLVIAFVAQSMFPKPSLPSAPVGLDAKGLPALTNYIPETIPSYPVANGDDNQAK